CALLDRIGHNYDEMYASGYSWPIVDMRTRFMRPLRFDQVVRVTATLQRWDHQLRVSYRICDTEHGGLLARGFTLQAPVDVATGTMFHGQPAAVTQALARAGLLQQDTDT